MQQPESVHGDHAALAPPPSVSALFFGFLRLGLIAFGGALPFARRAIVEQRRWMSAEEFTDLLGLCQFLPGGNAINLSVAVGMRFRGIRGALAAILGLIACPSLIVVGLGVIYEHTHNDPHVKHLFAGLAAAAAGLLVAMALKVAIRLRGQTAYILLAVVCFIAIAWLRLPLLPTMVVLTAIGFAIATYESKRATGGKQ
ncbi:MAG: chromate transporter [Janthinobacterium lividum]